MNGPQKSPQPVCAVLSLLLPAFGAGLWWIIAEHPHIGDGMNGYAGMFLYMAMILLSAALVMGALACAVASFVRRERWRFLAVISLVINVWIVLRFRH
jgi:hypothetical protein